MHFSVTTKVMNLARETYLPKKCPGPESNRHGSYLPRDFKSLASTSSATRACSLQKRLTGNFIRLRSESNRRPRLCRPLHNHSATQPFVVSYSKTLTYWSGK